MNLPYKCDYPMTVGELRNKLKGMPNDALVYVVTDTSDDNYDEEVGCLRVVHPIESVEREWVIDCSGLGDEPERNLIIRMSEDFYENYECKFKPKSK